MIDFRQQLRRKVYGRLALIALFCMLFFALSNQISWRSDWTQDQLYSLSPTTKKVLLSLQEPVFIHAYMSADMPQPYGHLQQFVEGMLMAYQQAGAGHISYAVVDPADDGNVQAALQALDIPKVQVQVVKDDQAQIKQGYLAIVVEYLDHKEVISVLQSETGFEYQLTQKIKKIIAQKRIKIALTSSFGARNLASLKQFTSLLKRDYELVSIDMQQQAVADDVQVVIVDAMDQPPSWLWRYHLDQFRMRGGGVLLLASAAKADLSQGFAVQAVQTSAHTWIADDLGISIEAGLVMDQQAERIMVRNGLFRSQVDYPFVINVSDLADDVLLTKALESVSMPFASPVLPKTDGFKVLLRSSAYSAVQNTPDFDVYPLLSMEKRFEGLQMRAFVLALYQQGAITSAFQSLPNALVDQPKVAPRLFKSKQSRLLVIGSNSLLDDEFMEASTALLVMNMVDWLAYQEDLIALRSRAVTDRPLAKLSHAGHQFFKVLWIFALPLGVMLLGLWRWRKLRRKALSW